MNKLAILAFSLLVFFSSILWYLANGSLNEFLKSQIQLQGQYYTKQATLLDFADYSADTGIGVFTDITLANPDGYQAKYALTIDKVKIELASSVNNITTKSTSPFKEQHVSITTIKQLTINKLILNIDHQYTPPNHEQSNATQSNINTLITQVKNQLALDYPEFYPEISAKLYAQKNPQLNAEAYANSHPQSGPIIEHKQTKKKRGKAQDKLKIQTIAINELVLNVTNNGINEVIQLHKLQLAPIGNEQGLVTNQIGGELLLALLSLSRSG